MAECLTLFPPVTWAMDCGFALARYGVTQAGETIVSLVIGHYRDGCSPEVAAEKVVEWLESNTVQKF